MSSRRGEECLNDIVEAITEIRSHLSRGDLSDGLIFDAVRLRLIEGRPTAQMTRSSGETESRQLRAS